MDSEDLTFEVELDDPVMAMSYNIEVYKAWLNNILHGYYTKKTEKRVYSDRKSRREFRRFMDKYNIQVHKDEDTSEGNHWTIRAGRDPEYLTGISSLRIRETYDIPD